MKIKYLQVLVPYEKPKSEMEKSIEDLIGWFKPKKKAVPEAAAYITRSIGETVGQTTSVSLTVNKKKSVKFQIPRRATYYRTLFTDSFKLGSRGPEIEVVYDDIAFVAVWPLEKGKSVTGSGKFVLVCPPVDHPMLRSIGCAPGKKLAVGTLKFNVFVESAEKVNVPAGIFNTFKIRYREQSQLSFMGRTKKREIETNWWFAPKLNWWVKRTNLQGKKMAVIEATDISLPQ